MLVAALPTRNLYNECLLCKLEFFICNLSSSNAWNDCWYLIDILILFVRIDQCLSFLIANHPMLVWEPSSVNTRHDSTVLPSLTVSDPLDFVTDPTDTVHRNPEFDHQSVDTVMLIREITQDVLRYPGCAMSKWGKEKKREIRLHY